MSRESTDTGAVAIDFKIQEIVRRIVDGFRPQRIILFGSQARGEASPLSDVDLLVVMSTDSKKETTLDIRLALRAMGVSKDIVVVTPDEFERKRDVTGSIVHSAVQEGRVLYDGR